MLINVLFANPNTHKMQPKLSGSLIERTQIHLGNSVKVLMNINFYTFFHILKHFLKTLYLVLIIVTELFPILFNLLGVCDSLVKD